MGDHKDVAGLEAKKKVLRDQLPYLQQNLGDPSKYIPYLEKGGVLDSHDKESIRSKASSKEKLEIFLKLLTKERKGVPAFDVFIAALLDEQVQSHVARQVAGRLQGELAYEKETLRIIDMNVSLENGIQYIRDTVGDQFSKDDMIDAIKYCNMDAAAAISHLHEKAANYASTPVNSHHPTITQSSVVTTEVQPNPTCQLTARTSHVPTKTVTANNMKEHYVQCDSPVTKQSPNVVISAKLSTSPSTRITDRPTSNLICPFSGPRWNVTVHSQKFDQYGGTLRISEHDIDIVIPELAISLGDVVEVQAAVILSGPYKTPLGYDPISVTVWLGASYKFNKLIRISIPHCVIINGPQDINGLVVLTATDKQFTVNTNSRRLSQAIEHTNCYCYEVNNPLCDYYTDNLHGNSICLARRSSQLTTLSIMVFYWKISNCQSADKLSVEFYFCYNLKYCVKSIKKAYKTRYSVKPCMSQWNIEIDSRYSQKFCLLHSINVPGITAVTGRCLNKVDIRGLDFCYFQSHIKGITEKEKSTVFLPQLDARFIRREKDSVINFIVYVECDVASDKAAQNCFRASVKLDKRSSANCVNYINFPLIHQNVESDQSTTAIAIASSALIVYAKEENDPHGEQVLCLSDILNNCGIQCDIDLYHINEDIMDWSFWVGKNLEYHIASQHGHIILVCSPTVIATLEERNDNARVEMVAAHINRLALRYHLEEGAQKIFPLFINDPLANCVPPSLSGKTCYHFPYDKLVNEIPGNATAKQILDHPDFASLRSLVALMTKQQEIPAPNAA